MGMHYQHMEAGLGNTLSSQFPATLLGPKVVIKQDIKPYYVGQHGSEITLGQFPFITQYLWYQH